VHVAENYACGAQEIDVWCLRGRIVDAGIAPTEVVRKNAARNVEPLKSLFYVSNVASRPALIHRVTYTTKFG
jgi:hypothetical protein